MLCPKRKKLEVSIEAKSDSKKQNKNNKNRLLYNPSSRKKNMSINKKANAAPTPANT